MESKNNGMLIGIVIAILVIFGGIILIANNDDDDESNEVETSQAAEAETNEASEEGDEEEEAVQDIVELAQATGDLSILVSAVVEAELVDTLSGEGPFTVFAPTNDAFANLLAELDVTAEELLAREDLGDILTYHVVAGEVMAADLSDGQVVETVQGGTLTVSIGEDGVTLTDANDNVSTVTATDIEASNGVVHLIDTVVLP